MIHLGSTIGLLSSLGGGATFLYGVYTQIRRGINAVVEAKEAFVRLVDEHHEMYGWYTRHVKPKHKSNGVALS